MAKKDRRGRTRSILTPYSRRQINREARARTRLEYAPYQRELRGDLRASQQQSRNINAWYGQYQRQMNALRAGQESALAAGQDRLRQDAAFLGEQGASRNEAVGADQERSAAIRGAVADPGQGATESAAERQRQALMASMRTRTDQIGQSSSTRLAGVNAAAELGRQADQRQERNTRLETRSKLRDVGRDKGAARIKNIGDVTRAEREQALQNRAFGLDSQKLNLERQKEARIASEGSGSSGGSGGSGGGGGYKGGEIRAGMAEGRKNLSEAGISAKNPRAIRQSKQAIIDGLVAHPNPMDPRLAQIVYRRLLKRAIRWDRNPNNVGSSAWNDKNQSR